MSTIMKKAKSDVWKHFIKESPTTARCILCTKILKHKGNTTNLHNHYKNVHRMHAETNEPMEPTCKQSKTSTEDTENIMNKENELHKETLSANISYSTLKTPTQHMDYSSDSNIDDPIPITYQKDTDTECQSSQSELSVTTSHSYQKSKFKDKRQVKKSHVYSLININHITLSLEFYCKVMEKLNLKLRQLLRETIIEKYLFPFIALL